MYPGYEQYWTAIQNQVPGQPLPMTGKLPIPSEIEWARGGKTKGIFTHVGLVPHFECFEACFDGWKNYINGNLKDLTVTGRGTPNKGEAMTKSEKNLVGAS